MTYNGMPCVIATDDKEGYQYKYVEYQIKLKFV